MRKILFIFIPLVMGLSAKSQPLIDTLRCWSVVHCSFYGNYFCTTDYYRIQGEVIIGTDQYAEVVTASDSSAAQWNLCALIREDSNKKVYVHIDTNDFLLYDFGLNVSDTFTIHFGNSAYPFYLAVDSADTLTLLNGEKRKRLFMSDGEQWIEGIGSTFGLLNVGYFYFNFDESRTLNCFIDKDTLKYHDPRYPSCNYTYGLGISEKNSVRPPIVVYPNPFTESTAISFENPAREEYSLKIYDLTGQLVKSIPKINVGEFILERENLPSGLYLFFLNSNTHFAGQGKLIVE